jgi:hypothetical protein
MPPALLFCISISFATQGLLVLHMDVRIDSSISVILMGVALNLKIAFGCIATFTILFLPIFEHGRSFHLLASSSISFLNVF